ncbi:MAG: hypothetical protein KGI70_01760 [Patescibacteria group bacterium]|nr:hypothetical protein [Patescibacteria group bacterium]
MHVVVAKVDEILFEGEARSLKAPGAAGVLEVRPGHMPLVTTLKAGEVTVDGKKFTIKGGILEVRPQGATVIL